MSGFPEQWLRTREPFDHAARSPELVRRLDAWLPPGPVSLVDLGCGVGSGMRYVAERLERAQTWTLVDHDPALLAAVDGGVETRCVDLRDPDVVWPVADVVVTQALLDLVSEAWLERLATWLAGHRLPLLAALTVDGRVHWHPSDRADAEVMAGFRAHQLTDRGFGPSPGPRAAPWLAGRLAAEGYEVVLVEADWEISGKSGEMMEEMVLGIAGAAAHMGVEVERWRSRRLSGTDTLRVGHLDLLALPPSPAISG